MHIRTILISLLVSLMVEAKPSIVNYHEGCLIPSFWHHGYTLHGQIDDFSFQTDNPQDPHKYVVVVLDKDNYLLYPHTLPFDANIENIQNGGLVYDRHGNLVAKMGSKVTSEPIDYPSPFFLEIEELYCLPPTQTADKPMTPDKYTYEKGLEDGKNQRSLEISKILQTYRAGKSTIYQITGVRV